MIDPERHYPIVDHEDFIVPSFVVRFPQVTHLEGRRFQLIQHHPQASLGRGRGLREKENRLLVEHQPVWRHGLQAKLPFEHFPVHLAAGIHFRLPP